MLVVVLVLVLLLLVLLWIVVCLLGYITIAMGYAINAAFEGEYAVINSKRELESCLD